jgi:hypothetical protein
VYLFSKSLLYPLAVYFFFVKQRKITSHHIRYLSLALLVLVVVVILEVILVHLLKLDIAGDIVILLGVGCNMLALNRQDKHGTTY